ncbi:MAG: S9 family peptidase [Acidobacteria bacterium]|nr:S9 family peptidase [Acidobacteriota bacterium]
MKRILKLSVALLIALIISSSLMAGTSQQANKRGITPEDYYAFQFLSDPQMAPDGERVAYVVTTVDRKQNRRFSSIWLTPLDSATPPRQLTASHLSSHAPRWSPDGQALAFISARPSANETGETVRPQVWSLSMQGGEPHRLTSFKNGVSSFQWSPDGKRLVCVSRVGPSDNRTDNRERSDVRHYKHISYKFNDSGWFDDKRSHLFVVEVENGNTKVLTSGNDWDDSDPQWSPDGAHLAFVSNRTGKAFDGDRNTDVFVIPADGGPLTKISDHPEPDYSPRWSPDGKTLAFIGSVVESSHPKIWLAASVGNSAAILAVNDLDLIPANLTWAEDGKALYFDAGVKGETQVFRVAVASQELKPITKGAHAVRNFVISDKTRKLVFMANDFTHLDDLYVLDMVADTSATTGRKLTHLNERWWPQLELMEVERLSYKGADGWDVDGFFVKPRGWKAGAKYPMVLSIHGGPAGMYGVEWLHEFQVYAANGWAVFFTNPRGSTGYGEKFERGIKNEWGGKDYVDVMNGVETILKKYDWIDRERLGVTGGSYGGFLTNWIVGHTQLFKAAVTLRSVVNFISDEGTRDGAYGHKRDFGGDLFEKFELYWERSPLQYAKNVKTPILILHSDNDYRVPLEQGEQWFRALKFYGATAELVIFPRENHNLTRTGEPRHLVESLNWQLYWFDKYLNHNPAAVPPDAK